MSKGRKPRPFSVDQQTFGNNYDAIFRKQPTFKDLEETADEQARLAELEEYRKQTVDQFFQDGSCTGGELKK